MKEEELEENAVELETEVEDINIEETAEETVEKIAEEGIEIVEDDADMYKKAAAENLDKYQRSLAEFDNFRKRTAKEKASMYDDGVRNTIEKILVVVDNLERAIAAQDGKGDEEDPFFKGVLMTMKQFQDVLDTLGVTEIKALGETFNPELHAAVAHEDNPAYGENEIMLEMLKGYEYKEKVIRHSMVKVAN
ncbi:MAG: nucleotide exchange factor GrpE [Bacillota bacterium]